MIKARSRYSVALIAAISALMLLLVSCTKETNTLVQNYNIHVFPEREEYVKEVTTQASIAPFEYLASPFENIPTLKFDGAFLDVVEGTSGKKYEIYFMLDLHEDATYYDGNIKIYSDEPEINIEYDNENYTSSRYFLLPVGNQQAGLFKWVDPVPNSPVTSSSLDGRVPLLLGYIPCQNQGYLCIVEMLHHEDQLTRIVLIDNNELELVHLTEVDGVVVNHSLEYIGNGYAIYYISGGEEGVNQETRIIQCNEEFCSGFNSGIPDPLAVDIEFYEIESIITTYLVGHQ